MTRFPVLGLVCPPPPPLAHVGRARIQSPVSQVFLPVGFRRLPFPCNSQILCVKETWKEISLLAYEEAEEQRGFGICLNHTAH